MTSPLPPMPDPAPAARPSADSSSLPPLFSQLPLSPAVLANLQQLGYLIMTPIQAASPADNTGGS